jgi:hypothetical protein
VNVVTAGDVELEAVTPDDGDPADPGGFLTGERLCNLRAWATDCGTQRKSVAQWRMSMDNEIIETLEEAKQCFADPGGSSTSVETIGYVGRANAN